MICQLILSVRVTAFRCHEDVVIAETATREIFYWGEIAEGQVITRPQHLTGTRLPRDVFGLSQYPGTGDMVQIGEYQRIEAETKWPPFCRRFFQIDFHD